MNATSRAKRFLQLLTVAGFVTGPHAALFAEEEGRLHDAPRWEAWLALSTWPSLNELQPAAGGSFKQLGYGLGAAAHWPVGQFQHGELMLGVEGAVMATDSDVPVLLDDLLARDGYLAVSAKWFFSEARNVSLDAGVAYHLVDIAQLDTDYNSSVEFESWEETAAGLFLGTTWDVSGGRSTNDGGLSLGLKVHFLDFGTVRDESVFVTPVLGPDAGDLDGPVYAFQIGYSWR